MVMENKGKKRSCGKLLADRVMEKFLVEGAEGFKFNKIRDVLPTVPKDLRPAGLAFISNLSGMISTTCIPVTIAIASAQQWRYKQILIAEKIRSRGGFRGAGRTAAETRAMAVKRYKDELNSKKVIDGISDTACDFLLNLHQNPAVCEAAAELLRQGIVLAWGALETLSRDVFEATVNARPLLGKKLLDSPDGRKTFQIKGIDFETLAKYDFNISKNMGSILVQFQDLSKLAIIRAVFESIFPDNAKLRTSLRSKQLWILNQRRHLIVHNRSVVDQRYLNNTGETIPVGHKITISTMDIEKYINLVQAVGFEIIDAAKTCMHEK